MTFQKGFSGNPTGRPKVSSEVKELAKKKAPEAFRRICELVGSEDEKIALAASREVLDRALGKPTQSVEHSGEITRFVIRAPQVEESVEAWRQKYAPKTPNFQ